MSTASLRAPAERRLLGAFLRLRREKLIASAMGLAVGGRRRTPGLRREEVAQLCGVSSTWYTWIEQGRDISVSPEALARIADVLRLSPAERAYMFDLAQKRDPSPGAVAAAETAAALPFRRAVERMVAPAYLIDRLWRAIAWNAAARHLFAGWLDRPDPCGLIDFVLLAPEARALIPDWDDRAHRLVAEFRADASHPTDDPDLRATIERLHEASPVFARCWADHAVRAREGGERLFRHPTDGLLRFEQVTLLPAGLPGHKLVMLIGG